MATGTYSVKAQAHIKRRGEPIVRRRAGIAFGSEETIVTTAEGGEGLLITEDQLDVILHDSNLREAQSKDASRPGLRVKNLEPASGQGEEASPIRRSHHRKA